MCETMQIAFNSFFSIINVNFVTYVLQCVTRLQYGGTFHCPAKFHNFVNLVLFLLFLQNSTVFGDYRTSD